MRFAGDMRAVEIAHEPVGTPIDPDAEPEGFEQRDHGGNEVVADDLLLDHIQLRVDDEPAVERRERCPKSQRLDEHGHAPGRAAAGDCKADSRVVQRVDSLDGARRQRLVRRHERPVDVREQHANAHRSDR